MYPAELCTIPLGFPVDPDVYKIKRGSSAFISTGLQSSSTLFNLLAGDYNVTVTDADGCYDSLNVTISEPQALSSTISSTIPI